MNKKIDGLDSLRFLCALTVVFAHIGPPPIFSFFEQTNAIKLIQGVYNNLLAPGSPAVIVFFVISGFCIHSAYVKAQKIALAKYYSRRYVRIGLPVLTVVVVINLLGINLDAILWSLIAEICYYTVYPLLLAARNRFGWLPILGVSYALAYLTILVAPHSPGSIYYHSFGFWLSPIIGLPCWILGCLLAEKVSQPQESVSRTAIWGWRLALLTLSFSCMTLMFQLGVAQYWTLDLFAIVVFFWLGREINYARRVKPNPRLEEWGSWSYSLYLCHLVVAKLIAQSLFGWSESLVWLISIVLILVFSYSFYLAVERPAHVLAKKLTASKSMSRPFSKDLVAYSLKERG